jgi:hypothetical protein
VHVPGEWFGTDQHGVDHREEVVVDADPRRPVNINIRPLGRPVWRETLLLRDWLRTHDAERDAYAAMKRGLAQVPIVTSMPTAKTRCPGSAPPWGEPKPGQAPRVGRPDGMWQYRSGPAAGPGGRGDLR